MSPKPIHELGPVILSVETFVEHQGQFLMHRRADDYPRWPGLLSVPGGRIDQGEDVMAAASREIREESGVKIPPEQFSLKAVAFHHWLDRGETWVAFICRAKLTATPPPVRSDSEGQARWMTEAELRGADKVLKPTLYYFDHVLSDRPGVLYDNIDWNNGELVQVHSKTVV